MIQTSEKIDKIAKKWAQVCEGVRYVQKTGEVSGRGVGTYSYASDLDLLEAVKERLQGLGVAFLSDTKEVKVEEVKTKNGHTRLTTVELTMMLIDGESGQWMRSSSTGQGTDTQDKGAYKAITGALKYWLRTSLLIPTGDDPDATASAPPAPIPKAKPNLKEVSDAAAQTLIDELKMTEEGAMSLLRSYAKAVAKERGASARDITAEDISVARDRIFDDQEETNA